MRFHLRPLLLVELIALALLGCAPPPQSTAPESARPTLTEKPPSMTLRVVGDPDLAKAISQLAGEWNAQTGGELQIASTDGRDVLSEDLRADALICPSHNLGPLALSSLVHPIPASYHQRADDRARSLPGEPRLQGLSQDSDPTAGLWPGVFPLLRAQELVWRRQPMGVPLGSPLLVVYYRQDLLDRLGRQAPKTWAEYAVLARLLADRKRLGQGPPVDQPWHGVLEPLGDGWGGLVLLARAGAYATHRGNYSTLFHVDTMVPLIDGPPFVRALEELVAAAKTGLVQNRPADPVAVRNAFWAGHCGMALTWPSGALKLPDSLDSSTRVGFAELPGAEDVYHVGSKLWEKRRKDEDIRIPMLGLAGRVGVVPTSAPAPDAAFRLLFWLSDEQWSRQVKPVASSSPMTTIYRRSQLPGVRDWVEPPVSPAAASRYGRAVEQALSRPRGLLALFVPGRDEYLAALDKAVRDAVDGRQSPSVALQTAAAVWQKTTDRLDRQRQRSAYRQSVGLD